jgi:hypothetical protein
VAVLAAGTIGQAVASRVGGRRGGRLSA